MKYDRLLPFRKYLNEVCKNKGTADQYYSAVKRLLDDQQFNSLAEIDPDWLKEKIAKVTTKNRFYKIKSGLQYLHQFDSSLQLPDEDFFKQHSAHKKNHAKRPRKTLYLDTINRKVNQINNPKIKYAYRLMHVSGLRVSETAALQKKDISIDGDIITVNVKHGKGGSNGLVTCMADGYLARRMAEYMEGMADHEKLFYSASTMQQKARSLGLECHDFRRIAAIEYRTQQMKAGSNAYTANRETKEFLRHTRFSTTKRYLLNRRLKFRQKEDSDDGSV